MNAGAPLDRRGFLVLGASLLLATSCDASSRGTDPPGDRPDSRHPSPQPATHPGSRSPTPTSPGGELPAVTAWTPDPADVMPRLKAQAALVVEALGAWGPGGVGLEAAAGRLRALGYDGRLAGLARSLLRPSPAAALEVLEAQYGGILPGTTSVLVVCRQWFGGASRPVRSGGTTVDVRLQAAQRHWRVTELHPAEPGPMSPDPSSLARRVLGTSRIELPPAARADVLAGSVHDSVLTALLRLSTTYRIGVSVIRSGHPLHVFGSTRISDHAKWRAFDTYRIDGRLVVDRATPHRLVTGYMQAAVEAGSYNVGGPYLPAAGGPFFSDATHHDHVHAGFIA